MRRLTAVILAATLSVAGLAACGNGGDIAKGSGSKSELKIAMYPGAFQTLPVVLAEKLGFFKKHGLEVQLLNVQGGPAATSAVLSKSADVMLNALDNVTLARAAANGPDFVIVSGNTNKQINSLLVRDGMPTPSLSQGYPQLMRDFKGKKIGVPARGSALENIVRIMLKAGGVDPDKDVTWVALGTAPAMAAGVASGQIDAILMPEPFITQLVDVQKKARIVLDTRNGQPASLQWPFNMWWALAPVISQKKASFTAFQAAMKDTYDYMAKPENLDSLIPYVQNFLATDEQTARALMNPLNISTFGYHVDRSGVERLWDVMNSLGLLKNAPSYDEVTDPGVR